MKISKLIINKFKKVFFNLSNEELSVRVMIDEGLKVGENVYGLVNCIIDYGSCWLIEIGNDVIFAPQVYLLAHDTSTKKSTGYVRIGKIKIGDNCFIGARVFIMPGVSLGENCIVGAASVVTKSFPKNSVIAGNPAKLICSVEEYEKRIKKQLENSPKFSKEYHLDAISEIKKQEMRDALNDNFGYIQ